MLRQAVQYVPLETSLTATTITDLLKGLSFNAAREADLHEALLKVLQDAGLPVRDEVILSSGERIDVLVGTVGVEIKTAGATATVLRQCQRYAGSSQVTELLLVTTVPQHRDLPVMVGGKPLTVFVSQSGWLA